MLLVGETQPTLGASLYQSLHGASGAIPIVSLTAGPTTAHVVASLITKGLVQSAHDCSEGGTLVALAEMLIAGHSPHAPIGAKIEGALSASSGDHLAIAAFAESPSRYLLEVTPTDEASVTKLLASSGIPVARAATLNASGSLTCQAAAVNEPVDDLTKAWRGTLDW